eukprot:XP_001703992.1 Hypothetical protein GL50803_12159 [Giardia lamblia ATCC 50803]
MGRLPNLDPEFLKFVTPNPCETIERGQLDSISVLCY